MNLLPIWVEPRLQKLLLKQSDVLPVTAPYYASLVQWVRMVVAGCWLTAMPDVEGSFSFLKFVHQVQNISEWAGLYDKIKCLFMCILDIFWKHLMAGQTYMSTLETTMPPRLLFFQHTTVHCQFSNIVYPGTYVIFQLI